MNHILIAKNTLYQTSAKIITAIVGFLITIIIARSLGVVGYGDFIKITVFVSLFYLPLDFGLNAIFLQFDKNSNRFRDLFYLRLLLGLGIFIVTNLIGFILPFDQTLDLGFSPQDRLGIFIFSFSLFSQSIILSATAIFQKKLNYFSYMLAISLGAIINLILITGFVVLKLSFIYILTSFVISSIATCLLLLLWTGERIFPVRLDVKFAREILIKSSPIGLMLIFNLIYFRLDTFLLSIMQSTRDVGIYGISYKFFDFLIALPLFLSNSLYPFLLQNKANPSKFYSLVKSYLLIFFISSIVIIVPFWFFSPLFGLIKTEYLPAIEPFRILLLSLPFFFITSLLQWVLISLEQQKYLMYVYLSLTILNIVLNIIFIPQYSYFASALITGICEIMVFIFLALKLLKVRKISEKES